MEELFYVNAVVFEKLFEMKIDDAYKIFFNRITKYFQENFLYREARPNYFGLSRIFWKFGASLSKFLFRGTL